MNSPTLVFGYDYANLYDLFYEDKPYDKEVETINYFISQYLPRNKEIKILDAGCGTGNHSVLLSSNKRYSLSGLDISQNMLDHARKKMPNMRFFHETITDFNLQEKFDAVLTMAAVLGYQTYNQEVMSVFRCVRTHLDVGGLYMFDVWYGPTVLQTGVGERVKQVIAGDKKILRLSKGTLHHSMNICRVQYQIWDNYGNEFVEDHVMRYFFLPELKQMLELNNFQVIRIGQCPRIHADPSCDCWHIMVVAKAI